MDKEHTCCVTGNRNLSKLQAMATVVKLAKEILMAGIAGYTTFLTGMDKDVDLMFARDVLSVKKLKPDEVRLVAVISHRGELNKRDKEFQSILKQCDQVVVLSESYHPGVYRQRDRWILEHSSRLIFANDGRAVGEAVNTVREAQRMGIEVWEAYLNDPEDVSDHPMNYIQ